MPASEIRKDAREALKGKWGKAIGIVLVYFAISFAVGMIEGFFKRTNPTIYNIIDLAYAIISVPLNFGLVISFMKLKRSEEVSVIDFIKDGFSRFGKAWGVSLYTLLKLLLPFLCLFLVAVLMITLVFFNIKAGGNSGVHIALTLASVALYIATLVYVISRVFLYILSLNIAYDHPELSSKACVLKSEALMKGNRGSYFLLELSFIGWSILAVLSLGIGMLWLLPYMQVAAICFYEKVAKVEPKVVDGTATMEEEKVEE